MSELFISIPKLAKILGISRIAVYKKVKKNEIKAVKIGKNYAISTKYISKNIVEIKENFLSIKKKIAIEDVVNRMADEYFDTFRKLGKN